MTRMARGGEGDSYTSVSLVVLRKLQRSIIVVNQFDEERPIGRSLLSHMSEEEVEGTLEFPATLELEIRSWIVKKEKLE